ncbi:asparagine synthase (glutamine-hydrolyzing) [Methanohalophilus levihalophilus]|uniref:asparagine synthase (glutamine-hydrolyzing) n=1 Tax=Methanohalophilus levihalophilus TaxID=1431282 RepID=UPI001AE3ACEF|nr:asparagine synthase (glutamine-hydrolyzing) [Methanohalophilus levihalophilus]
MCGIAGVYGLSDQHLLRKMCDVIEHRGPDDAGYYVDEQISIGMRRLSIIDLSGGHQPVFNEDGSIVVVFNGEIYNFRELREDLEKRGHIFSTNSDTETIVHAYEEYGNDCLNKFNGMFAIALWDTEKKELFLARDRLGIKPLYYSLFEDKLIFGSEIKSLIEYGLKPEIKEEALSEYFTFRYVPAPLTMFRGIFKLKPGHFIKIGANGFHANSYWNLDFTTSEGSEGYFKDKILEILKESVRKRLVADVPIGSFLSGGLDSSIITSFASELSNEPIKTFSVGFYGSDYDETPYSRRIAEHFGTDHTEEWVDIENTSVLPKLIYHLDEPLADPAILPTYLISETARKKVKVILSGEGGDEAFAGYGRYQSELKAHNFSKYLPRVLKNSAFRLGSIIEESKIKKYALYAGSRNGQKNSYYYRLKLRDNGHLNPNILQIDDTNLPLDLFYEYDNYLKSMLKFDINYWLPDDLLMKVDKMTMATSLEARVPFLDHNLLELTSTIPPNLMLNKHLLKLCANDLLPKEVMERKKHGFDVPIREWFEKDTLDEFLSEEKINSTPYLNNSEIQKIRERHRAGKGDYSVLLWKCLCYTMWYNEFLSEN